MSFSPKGFEEDPNNIRLPNIVPEVKNNMNISLASEVFAVGFMLEDIGKKFDVLNQTDLGLECKRINPKERPTM